MNYLLIVVGHVYHFSHVFSLLVSCFILAYVVNYKPINVSKSSCFSNRKRLSSTKKLSLKAILFAFHLLIQQFCFRAIRKQKKWTTIESFFFYISRCIPLGTKVTWESEPHQILYNKPNQRWKMVVNSNSNSQHFPIFKEVKYHFWSLKMKSLLSVKRYWTWWRMDFQTLMKAMHNNCGKITRTIRRHCSWFKKPLMIISSPEF